MSEYRWISGEARDDIADEYEALLRPDLTTVTVITEPEDRTGWRDLRAVAEECNRLFEERRSAKLSAAAAEAQLARIKEALKQYHLARGRRHSEIEDGEQLRTEIENILGFVAF